MTNEQIAKLAEKLCEGTSDDPTGAAAAKERYFAYVWAVMADTGAVDAFGGAECRRVHREWIHEGRSLPLTRWMRWKGYLPELPDDDDDETVEIEPGPLDGPAAG